MAENKRQPIVVEDGKCDVGGCLGHVFVPFQCHAGGDKNNPEMVNYKSRVHFTSMKDLLECGGESVKRKLQAAYGRAGEFPTDRIVDVDAEGKFSKTDEDIIKEEELRRSKMTPAQIRAENARLQKLIAIYHIK